MIMYLRSRLLPLVFLMMPFTPLIERVSTSTTTNRLPWNRNTTTGGAAQSCSSPSSDSTLIVWIIAGGEGMLIIVLLIGGIIYSLKWRRQHRQQADITSATPVYFTRAAHCRRPISATRGHPTAQSGINSMSVARPTAVPSVAVDQQPPQPAAVAEAVSMTHTPPSIKFPTSAEVRATSEVMLFIKSYYFTDLDANQYSKEWEKLSLSDLEVLDSIVALIYTEEQLNAILKREKQGEELFKELSRRGVGGEQVDG